MGQQQLHLLVLGIILVGLAVIIGLGNFQNIGVQSNRDAVILDLNHIASFAQAYYKKAEPNAGGGNNFIGYNIPPQLNANDNGTYNVISTTPKKITIEGIGVEKDSNPGCSQGSNITYHIIVEPNQTILQKIH
ncbi:MAG: hypothetical protein DRQ13_02610 [Ignavibacteriae bacterium]|nr:MAG: hypothetical protein DRQ13_02610 [Ignavibacteriota bacterium]